MIIGVPKEIKAQENRIAITPAGVKMFVDAGHSVYIEKNAGSGSAFSNEEYLQQGAQILDTPQEIFAIADMIIKVKEPLPAEYELIRADQILFTYLHLAPDAAQTAALLKSKCIGIAYETVQLANGTLPLLAPMSEVAGRMSLQVGANLLQKINDGRGVLLGGVPGVEPGKVVIIGAGIVGLNAAKMAVGLGAQVTVLDISPARLAEIDDIFNGRVVTLMSNSLNIEEVSQSADLLISAVLIPGASAPKLITEDIVKSMKKGAVIVDVAIDQGGCVATMDRITSHKEPYFLKHGVVHYSVANMPGAVPRTSTIALTNATMPYALQIANLGAEQAMKNNPALLQGLNTYKGKLTYKAVADAQGLAYEPVFF